MSRNIFDSTEVEHFVEPVIIEAPKFFSRDEHLGNIESIQDTYDGPTAEEIREAAMQERLKWESERSQMLSEAQSKADEIVVQTENKIQESKRLAEEEIARSRQSAKEESERLVGLAKQELEQSKQTVARAYEEETEKARKLGYEEGYESGFKEGKDEAMRLVDRIHVIIDKIIEKRNGVLTEVESQVVELTLLMTRKVVKVLSENQKSVVINNVMQALKKVKGRGDVTVRVNMKDLSLSSEHISDFIDALEKRGNVILAEDSSIEAGGCIIETDFGEIDARISSQLNEIESRIRDLMPIVTKPTSITE